MAKMPSERIRLVVAGNVEESDRTSVVVVAVAVDDGDVDTSGARRDSSRSRDLLTVLRFDGPDSLPAAEAFPSTLSHLDRRRHAVFSFDAYNLHREIKSQIFSS